MKSDRPLGSTQTGPTAPPAKEPAGTAPMKQRSSVPPPIPRLGTQTVMTSSVPPPATSPLAPTPLAPTPLGAALGGGANGQAGQAGQAQAAPATHASVVPAAPAGQAARASVPPRKSDAPRPWDDPAWQKLWLATQKRPWNTLAIVPASRELSTIDVANVLAQVGWQHRGQPITVFDLTDVNIGYIDIQLGKVAAQVQRGERVILALKSIFENPSTTPLVHGVDAAILCVALGKSAMAQAEQTLDEIGRDRFLGSIVLQAAPATAK